MDDFERDFPDFDWKNIPAYKHPGGKDCPCPKHEYIREQINVAKSVSQHRKTLHRVPTEGAGHSKVWPRPLRCVFQ